MRHARVVLLLVAWSSCLSVSQAGPPIFGPPGYYYGPYYGPYFGGPGYGPVYPSYFGPPPIRVVIPVRIIMPPLPEPSEPEPQANLVRDEDFPDKIVIRPRQQQQLVKREERPVEEPPLRALPGQPAGEFRPIPAEERARVQPDRPPMPMIPDQPEKDPLAEAARQLALGKLAFAAREYGRAERRFEQATRVAAKEPIPYFFLAQARVALGKYREASAAIHDGLRAYPDWPSLPIKIRDLYEDNPADYALHRKQLEAALAAHAEDPVLLFLQGYQLWFDGQQDEARPLFRRAARLVTAPLFIDLFLLQPAGPVARR